MREGDEILFIAFPNGTIPRVSFRFSRTYFIFFFILQTMTEDTLLRDIHRYLTVETENGRRVFTEQELTEHFQVTRYRIRQCLAKLSRLGAVASVKKKGLTLLQPSPDKVSQEIHFLIGGRSFEVHELAETLKIFLSQILSLSARRMTPQAQSNILTKLSRFATSVNFPSAAWSFHFQILERLIAISQNRVLQTYGLALIHAYANYFKRIKLEDPLCFIALEWDQKLFQAIQKNDVEKITFVVEQLIENTLLSTEVRDPFTPH